jgi:outer membrane protein OmpA-like peptidoglycan-associated protein
MPDFRRGVLLPVLIILLLAAGFFLIVRLGGDIQREALREAPATLSATPELRLQFGRNRLNVTASIRSPDHENALRELLGEQFADSRVEADFREGLLLPAAWETITTRLFHVVATTSSATVAADEQGIRITATTDDPEDYQSRLALLENALRSDDQLVSDIIPGDPEVDLQDLCARNFSAITEHVNVVQQALRFRQSSTDLSESAHALLDRIAEFAYECQQAKIAILGHTDATGAETWNLQVSQARAEAVAAQLIQRGVAADRLFVEGRGSQSPLADNDTVQGRAQNRRIEFELR